MTRHSNLETEIKLRIDDPVAVRRELRRLGFKLAKRRVFEVNTVFDTPDGLLRRQRKLLRLRQAGARNTITFKGPPAAGRHKSREEVESQFGGAGGMRVILERLGYNPVFLYEKYRTEYARPDQAGLVVLDETPIGDFLELEGSPRWIDRTARELGRSPADYITESYGALYLEDCAARGVEPSHMVFGRRPRSQRL
jgi:adenylate cyclase class 2